jgi:hypothetical protein
VLEDSQGHRFIATFPEALKRPAQVRNNIKAHSVYMSQFQRVPEGRVRDHFADQMSEPVSSGSICNVNLQAYNGLPRFENWAKARNPLKWLVNDESDDLRYTTEEQVPFTHIRGENDPRITKVQQKISGCFRSMDGAKTLALCAARVRLLY